MRKQILIVGVALVCAAIIVFYGPREGRANAGAHADRTSAQTTPVEAPAGPRMNSFLDNISDTKSPGGLVQQPQPQDIRTTEKFQIAQSCYFAKAHVLANESALVECEALAGVKEAAEQYKMCSEESQTRAKAIAVLQSKVKECPPQLGQLSQAYYQATKDAAAAGDVDAQMCYVQSTFGETVAFSPEETQDYETRAMNYAQSAFLRGDWRIVALLSDSNYLTQGLIQKIASPDAATRYRLNRLLRLGATGAYAKRLDLEAQSATLAKNLDGTLLLSHAERSAGEKWAQATFAAHFVRSPSLSDPPNVCAGKQA